MISLRNVRFQTQNLDIWLLIYLIVKKKTRGRNWLTYARCCQVIRASEHMFHSWVRSYSSRIFGKCILSVCDTFPFKQKFWLRRRHLTLSMWGRVSFRRKIWQRRRDLTLSVWCTVTFKQKIWQRLRLPQNLEVPFS